MIALSLITSGCIGAWLMRIALDTDGHGFGMRDRVTAGSVSVAALFVLSALLVYRVPPFWCDHCMQHWVDR